jgi:hypothetical protein
MKTLSPLSVCILQVLPDHHHVWIQNFFHTFSFSSIGVEAAKVK